MQFIFLDKIIDPDGHIGGELTIGNQFPIGYWNRAILADNKEWDIPEPVDKDILLSLKESDFIEVQYKNNEGKIINDSLVEFDWGSLIIPFPKTEVVKELKNIRYFGDRAYFFPNHNYEKIAELASFMI